MIEKTTEVLIIGAGPSGCVAASYLQMNGIQVTVVEKNSFPRFVIGESLIPRCMDHFEEAGLLNCLKERNYEIKRGARFIKGDVVCEFDFSKKFTDGWNWTWQVPRSDFDNTLANELIKKGIDVRFEQEVTDVHFDPSGKSRTTVRNAQGTDYIIEADYIIDSSGYGRVLPRLLDLIKPSALPKHSSLFTHVKDLRRPEGTEGTLITFDVLDTETWIWVIPFSNGTTSIGLVGPTEYFDEFSGNPTEKLQQMMALSDHYRDRFDGLEYEFEPKLIQNFSSSVKQLYGKGYVLTGNSAEFLDPVFSSGVTFATESGLLAAKLIVKETNGKSVDWDEEYVNYMKSGVSVFSDYVREWYTGNLQTLFFHHKENSEVKEQICSVLAGYVWDQSNPFVKNSHRLIKTLAAYIRQVEV